MPLITSELPKITSIDSIVGKRIVDESLLTNAIDVDYPVENVVFTSQLPKNFVIFKQGTDKTALIGAGKSGLYPLIVDENNIVIASRY